MAKSSKVELSTDGGSTWNEATLLGELETKRVATLGIRLENAVPLRGIKLSSLAQPIRLAERNRSHRDR